MKYLRKLYYRWFPTYERLEMKLFSYREGDALLKENDSKPDDQKWHLAKEEDANQNYGFVYLERRRRVIE